MGNQFKGTLDLNRLRTFIRMAAVQPSTIVRFYSGPLNLAMYYMLFPYHFLFILFYPGSSRGRVPEFTGKGI